MTDRMLSDAEIDKMQTPLWEQAKRRDRRRGGPTTAPR